VNRSPKQLRPLAAILAMAAVVSGIVFWLVTHRPASIASNNTSPKIMAAGTNPPIAGISAQKLSGPAASPNTAPLPASEFSWFRAHPFAAAASNSVYAWTAEDGKDTNIIRQLAHNELEYQRMVKENDTIYRRQLVYHPEGFTLLAQQAVQSGQGIQELTLPGLDGQALPVTVTKTDFESGGDRGLFYGKLPGQTDSLVTVAFIGSREAFTVVSPQNQIYLQGESREPGEIVVKQIDPQKYAAGVCGNP
jgi:hypothetical protein